MKTTVEFNSYELRHFIQDGTLLALTNSCLALEGTKEAKEIIQTAFAEPTTVIPTVALSNAPAAAPAIQQTEPQPAPIMQPTPVTAPTTATPAAVPPTATLVPTSTPAYSVQDLAMAGVQLVDTGRRQEVLDLLASFGCGALTELPKEQYGAYATRLREMGAKI